jgi:thiamine transporter
VVKDMRNRKRKIIVEAGILISLALMLEYLTLFIPGMPQGGKFISLGMIPLIIFSLFRGWKWGISAGAVFGILYFYLVERFFVHPAQFLLDYILAFGSVGVAGFYSKFLINERKFAIPAAVITACLLRFLCHLLSGVIFIRLFLAEVPENPWLYSFMYNITYTIPTIIVCTLLIPPLIRRLRFYFTNFTKTNKHCN